MLTVLLLIRKPFILRMFSKVIVFKKLIVVRNSNLKYLERAQFYAVATLNVINSTTVIPSDIAVTNGGIVSRNSLYGVSGK